MLFLQYFSHLYQKIHQSWTFAFRLYLMHFREFYLIFFSRRTFNINSACFSFLSSWFFKNYIFRSFIPSVKFLLRASVVTLRFAPSLVWKYHNVSSISFVIFFSIFKILFLFFPNVLFQTFTKFDEKLIGFARFSLFSWFFFKYSRMSLIENIFITVKWKPVWISFFPNLLL